jgi:hypothetical protein
MGAGAPGGLGFVQGEELEEEVEGSSRTCLPRAEIDEIGWNFRSTPASGVGLPVQCAGGGVRKARRAAVAAAARRRTLEHARRRRPPFL